MQNNPDKIIKKHTKGIWAIRIFKIHEGYYSHYITRKNTTWLSGAYEAINDDKSLTEAIRMLEDYVWNDI